ncbi:MAG: hypothetical protein LBJ18_04780 [Rickettsiales bacterium]|nr:hypothetical protein [Rickettsiales bacterium]
MNNIFSRKNIAASAIVLLMIAPAFAKAQIKNGQSKNLTACATNPAKLNEMSLDEDWLACNALDGFQQKLTGTEKNLISDLQLFSEGVPQNAAAKKIISPDRPSRKYCANAQKNSIIKTLVDSLGMDPSISKKVQSYLTDGSYNSINQVKAAYPECVFVGTVYKDSESYNAALDRFLRANKRAGTDEEQERLLNKFAQNNRVVYPEEAVYLVVPRPGKGKGHATLLSDDQQFSFNNAHITPMPDQIRNASIIYLEQFLESLIRDEIRRIKNKPEDALKQSLTPLDDKYLEDIVRNMGKQDLIKLQIIKLLGKEVKAPEIRTGGAPIAFNAKQDERYARDYLANVQRNQFMAFENSRGGRVG